MLHLLLALMIALIPFDAQAQRAMPDDNLAYPVLITSAAGAGSGFFVRASSGMFFVTAKQVLFENTKDGEKLKAKQAQLLSYSINPAETEPNVEVVDFETLDKAGLIKAHVTHDVAVVKIGDVTEKEDSNPPHTQFQISPPPGVLYVKTTEPGLAGAAPDIIKKFDKVLVGNDVIVYGYPLSLALQESHQLEPLRPLLRKGMVAGQNVQNRSIVLDCPVYFGNSGGPVIQVEATRSRKPLASSA
jgi:hypothetical protein